MAKITLDEAASEARPDGRPDARPDPGFPPGVAYVDGRFCPISEAKISVLDWGFLHSDATYDVVHVWKRRFFRLEDHLDRFQRSVAKLRMSLPFDREALREVLMEAVRRTGFEDAYVEMFCTRGRTPGAGRDPRQAINNVIAFVIPFGWIADAEQRARGLSIAVALVKRIPAESVDPTVKNYHWLDIVAGLFEAFDRGAENVVLTDLAGNVTEGAGFNVFAVASGRVFTPERGVLEGITRRSAIELCQELGVPVTLAPLPVARLRQAEEIFITSTAGGIMPVTKIDGAAIGDGRPGALTKRLTALYWDKHADPAWTTPVE
ncbi:MAG: aminotransferase class IV [Alphaproteobacteria bacterium]